MTTKTNESNATTDITLELIERDDLATATGGEGPLWANAGAIESGHGWANNGQPNVAREGMGYGALKFFPHKDEAGGGQWSTSAYDNATHGRG